MSSAATPRTVGVCIATHERADMLRRALAGLRAQRCPPAEIVVSDSSSGTATRALVEETAAVVPGVRVRHLPSPRRALPWQRWWAAREVTADVVLFLDDDVVLRDDALGRLLDAYGEAARRGDGPVAGVGFVMIDTDPDAPDAPDAADAPRALDAPRAAGAGQGVRERWLRLASLAPGSMTAGGITVALPSPEVGGLARVRWLCGGGMSYPRDVLRRVGHLDELSALYERRLGKGEDAVLSVQASRHGALYVIAEPLARHLEPAARTPRVNTQAGWRRGLWGTWGRAHTMRWVADDPAACRRDWSRLVLLETARSLSAVARAPWRADGWARMAGSILGGACGVVRWNRIPSSPGSGRELAL